METKQIPSWKQEEISLTGLTTREKYAKERDLESMIRTIRSLMYDLEMAGKITLNEVDTYNNLLRHIQINQIPWLERYIECEEEKYWIRKFQNIRQILHTYERELVERASK